MSKMTIFTQNVTDKPDTQKVVIFDTFLTFSDIFVKSPGDWMGFWTPRVISVHAWCPNVSFLVKTVVFD